MLAAIFTNFRGVSPERRTFFRFNDLMTLFISAGFAFGKSSVSICLLISVICKTVE